MTTKTLSTHAACAKAIRAELKATFPGVNFRVRSRSFTGGDAVDIGWVDGPTSAMVEAVSGKYQYGQFDGMIDLYENTNMRDDLPQAKYVHPQRELSDEALQAGLEFVNRRHGTSMRWDPASRWVEAGTDRWVNDLGFYAATLIHQYAYRRTMFCPTCHQLGELADRFCWSCGEEINPE